MKFRITGLAALTRRQQFGIFLLVGIISMLQLALFRLGSPELPRLTVAEKQWLAMQKLVDSMSRQNQTQRTIRKFNPNFLDDARGYRWGMSVAEIDRLLAFRQTGKFVNSADEFQQVTQVPDSVLAKMAPYFSFPDWVNKRKGSKPTYDQHRMRAGKVEKPAVITDINTATQEELMAVYGIGPGYSKRILAMREQLGGFVSMQQMQDVYGLPADVVEALNKKFGILSAPAVRKVRINDASLSELAKFPYFRYALAREIVAYRSMNGGVKSAADLEKIKNFPTDRIDIISLYLEL